MIDREALRRETDELRAELEERRARRLAGEIYEWKAPEPEPRKPDPVRKPEPPMPKPAMSERALLDAIGKALAVEREAMEAYVAEELLMLKIGLRHEFAQMLEKQAEPSPPAERDAVTSTGNILRIA